MINFYKFLKIINEANEQDLFDFHPDDSEPKGGSSHNIYRLKGKKGGDYWSKSAASNLQTINEYLAWKIYKLYDISIASNAYLVVRGDKLRLVTTSVGGNQLPLGYDDDFTSYLKDSDVHKGFFVDVFLGHWDVVGNAPRSNLFIDDQKRVTRIDLGGMDFRATGPRKSKTIPGSWGPEVGEITTMGGLGGELEVDPMLKYRTNNANKAFEPLRNNREFLKEAADVFIKINWNQLENTINSVVLEVEQISKEHNLPHILEETKNYIIEIKDVLKSRFEDLHKKIKKMLAQDTPTR